MNISNASLPTWWNIALAGMCALFFLPIFFAGYAEDVSDSSSRFARTSVFNPYLLFSEIFYYSDVR